MKRKRSAISGQEIFNRVGKQIISVAMIQCEGKMYCGTCADFFLFFFCWTSGLSLWASDFLGLLAHCLVSKKVSFKHC